MSDLTAFESIAKRIARAMVDTCRLSPADAEQEAMVALLRCADTYGDRLNGGMVAIAVRNHLLDLADKQSTCKRKAKTVHLDRDIYPANMATAEQLAIAADTEARIADACESVGMSPERTVATLVALHTLSSRKYQQWIQDHPAEWGYWLDASDMAPARASELSPVEARRLFVRLMATLRSAKQ